MLKKVQSERYAAPAFNIYNPETLQVVVKSVAQLRSPAILAETSGTYRYGDVGSLISLARSLARECNLPLALHLNHHEESDDIFNKVRAGIRSVMIDGSHLPSEDNIAQAQEVTTSCRRLDVSVEAKLGRLGSQEDDLWVNGKDSTYTSPAAATEFVQRTQIDPLVVATGTAHGLYTHESQPDFVWLEQIRQRVEVPLVLHGASGLSEQDAQHCIRHGICKVNVAIGLKIAFAGVLKGYFYNDPAISDSRHCIQPVKAAMGEVVTRITGICDSEGKI